MLLPVLMRFDDMYWCLQTSQGRRKYFFPGPFFKNNFANCKQYLQKLWFPSTSCRQQTACWGSFFYQHLKCSFPSFIGCAILDKEIHNYQKSDLTAVQNCCHPDSISSGNTFY